MKGMHHNSFFVRNQRVENLGSLFGMNQGTDMDMYDYEFDKEGQLTVIHANKNERTITLGSVFPTKEIADEVCKILHEKR